MKNDLEYMYHILKESNNLIKLTPFNQLKFQNSKIDQISIDIDINNIITKKYRHFNIDYYKNCKKKSNKNSNKDKKAKF
jgi:hypothetical protein